MRLRRKYSLSGKITLSRVFWVRESSLGKNMTVGVRYRFKNSHDHKKKMIKVRAQHCNTEPFFGMLKSIVFPPQPFVLHYETAVHFVVILNLQRPLNWRTLLWTCRLEREY